VQRSLYPIYVPAICLVELVYHHRLGPRNFSKAHNLDIPAIVRRLNFKPRIRVEARWFVTYIENHRYVLGKTDAGIRPAVREALQLHRENRLTHEIAS